MLADLKKFLLRGNVVDLAVAVIIGAAFGAIITSLVADVITPLIGMVFGSPDFSGITLGAVKIGSFINAVVNFLIIGISMFFVVKGIEKAQNLTKKEEEKEEAPVDENTELLKEIRDLLAKDKA